MGILQKAFYLFFYLLLSGCIDPYLPPAIRNAESYLVVEGFINASGTTKISLTKTDALNSEFRSISESGAAVTIESENESLGVLEEISSGIYIGNFNLSNEKEYRVKINTSDGEEYFSEFVPVKESPPIEDVFWESNEQGVTIYLNTRDPLGATQYYRWKFFETWEFDAFYTSFLKYDNGSLVEREMDDMIKVCWQSDSSSRVLTASTARLGQDVVYKYPITNIPFRNWKLSKKYSILVTQYPITKEAYEFYELLKSNSEELGSFFDPQPTQIRGNMYNNSDPEKLVIGFISAGTTSEKRLYIENHELEDWVNFPLCELFDVPLDSIEFYFSNGNFIPLYNSSEPGIIRFKATSRACADCTTRGTKVEPSFWE